MSNGAYSIHLQLKNELINYIKSQYFGKSKILLSSLGDKLAEESLLYQKPYIESSPAYTTIENGIQSTILPSWLKQFFNQLSNGGLGIYTSPFTHQVQALNDTYKGFDLFVSTGTGSGKTECFMWPLVSKLVSEAHDSKESWSHEGVRSIILYPMNALVSDQVSRLRKLIGDPNNVFLDTFHKTCGSNTRRPKFGMYTGRTPYPGENINVDQDKQLAKTLSRMITPRNEKDKIFLKKLQQDGKIPAKSDLNLFLERLKKSEHIPNENDAELITRFEMQKFCPDILITNYSMLEYMLIRPRENKIWDDTRKWLNLSRDNKLLFIIDEAHMYKGSSGGEVALLIRRLMHKLGINRDKVQFILTSASMPNETEDDLLKVLNFARDLTASHEKQLFSFLRGEEIKIDNLIKYDIPFERFIESKSENFEDNDSIRLSELNSFWTGIPGSNAPFESTFEAYEWLYNNLSFYRPFNLLLKITRGKPLSLNELSKLIFSKEDEELALTALSTLLAIAPLAKNKKNAVLFPARMHMLFRGISGVYACSNENCPSGHMEKNLKLGEIFLTDGNFVCPHCNSVVYELYNDRRCGALFFKGYIIEEDLANANYSFLWRNSGHLVDKRMKEVHLYIPPSDYSLPMKNKQNPTFPCYLDTHSGFLHFKDDSLEGHPGFRKLYYCNYSTKGKPDVVSFATCPHCLHLLSKTQLSSFSTRGNQSFFNLIKSQFLTQPAVPGKDTDPTILPNEGRKVLLFSDSRQRAAKLARDMSSASDIAAVRQLFAISISYLQDSQEERSMDDLYDYFCLAAGRNHVQLFHDIDRSKFLDDSKGVLDRYKKAESRKVSYVPRLKINNSPDVMKEYLIRLYCGGYNTLYDSASSWIEPMKEIMYDSIDDLEELGIEVTAEEFLEVFNAWMISICDTSTALGHTISDAIRLNVRKNNWSYGVATDWKFPKIILKIMNWDVNIANIWFNILKKHFLDKNQIDSDNFYVDLSRVKPCMLKSHDWFRCDRCSELTPYLLKKSCPSCGSNEINLLGQDDLEAMNFWRKPLNDALSGERIRVINTEEHTAQLSHKDQRDELWSKTESYEMRFQDLLQEDETPVDILSSTTTMEVGIDIGSLVAVGLRNIPPMRENYQQRAGRAGRRGSSLSTIITYCEDGPHDTLYFNNPIPMFRGKPRSPWIDIRSIKLIHRHLNIIILKNYLETTLYSMDMYPAATFLDNELESFSEFVHHFSTNEVSALLPYNYKFDEKVFKQNLLNSIESLRKKRESHPELYGVKDDGNLVDPKSLLDALYEEGIIPTYSFPKNVVSTHIVDSNGKMQYRVERGLDVAINEYAPGRAIVIDKQTYQIGGFYYPGVSWNKSIRKSPAKPFIEDPNYLKELIKCDRCGWFGLNDDKTTRCPFCNSPDISFSKKMLKPWGFAPLNGTAIQDAQLEEELTYVQPPLYSTLPETDDMKYIKGSNNTRYTSRENQRIIMLNNGVGNRGFLVCSDCGAAIPGDSEKDLALIKKPYKTKYNNYDCKHVNHLNVDIGFDFVTDMFVLEIKLDEMQIDTRRTENLWLARSAQTLSEAIRLSASKELDVEFTEIVSGYRLRQNQRGFFIDIYLYDNLSSGAGYAAEVANEILPILVGAKRLLSERCNCDSACYSCLKHYHNQRIHGLLDRFAALNLLEWSLKGKTAVSLSFDEQLQSIKPLASILNAKGYRISYESARIYISKEEKRKELYVYPAMWFMQTTSDVIHISDVYLKYAKPYALQKIFDSF